tara:strand:- start:680 stop:949 length:270 start_codon:yes stop_codon:yes gene_type:complete
MTTNEIIIRAIQKIKANVQVSVSDGDIDTIVWENGETPISKSDIEAKLTEAENELNAEVQTKINKKASGKQKLKDLGLDDAEINALMGV